MTCNFRPIGSIVDVENIKKILYKNEVFVSEGFDDSWNWSVDDTTTGAKENWLEECHISLSPTSELLVLAKDRNLAILNAKWDSHDESEAKIKYILSWNGDPTEELSEKITCVLCLPIAGKGKLSAHCGADWTAVAVGFTSGAVRFYTEKGGLLLSEVLHDEKVTNMKFQSFQPSPNLQLTPIQVDELHVTYKNVVCSIHGFALCDTLKACRNQLARLEANCSGETRVEAPLLALSKWGLPDQELVIDTAVLGSWTTPPLTHLVTASVRGGYFATYRSSPPQVTTILATGLAPYLGYHSIVEGSAGPVLADVARAMANKLKSAVGNAVTLGWFAKRNAPAAEKNVKEKQPADPPESMICRFGLCDILRKGERIYLSHQKNLSVVCDSLGRVILIDNPTGLALRMWKGYRDAECAFIPVDEEKIPNTGRTALYLAIYAPRKGIIEIWALQQGPKVATLMASKNGRLLYIKHGIMGVSNTSSRTSNLSPHPCVFINNYGIISDVYVPFHAILSNRNDPRSRDLHIIKQIRRALHTSNRIDDIVDLCTQLSTDEIRLQTLQLIASYKHVSANLIQRIISTLCEKIEGEETKREINKCWLACKNIEKVMNFYNTTLQLQEAPPEYSTVVRTSYCLDELGLSKLLRMSEDEVKQLISLISQCPENGHISSVKFTLLEDRLPLFLASVLPSITKSEGLIFSQETSSDQLANIGEVLCQCVLYGSCSIDDWKEQAIDSGIEQKSLFYAALCYWLKKPLGSNVSSELGLFTRLLIVITSIVSIKETLGWWDHVRSYIMESQNLTNALTATVISRSIYLGLEEKLSDESDDEWEAISRESCMWSQLASQVEAIALLQCSISFLPKQKFENTVVPSLDYVKQSISLSQIISKGPGRVCECVSKWLCSWGLAADWLLYEKEKTPTGGTNRKDLSEDELPTPADEARTTTAGQEDVLKRLALLRKYFQTSLSSGPLLSNIVWEYIVAWTKKPDRDELFSTALTFLRYVPIHSLRQGLCSIIWNVHIRAQFESTIKLLHKIGKLPKERICKQYINMTDTSVKHWLRNLYDFFNIFIESTTLAEESAENWSVERETLWTDAEEMQPSLTDIALAQATPNVDVLDIMCQAIRAIIFLAAFPSLRLQKPITTLFDSFGEACLWCDIRSNAQLPNPSPNKNLSDARSKYLIKVITIAIEKFATGEEENVSMKETVGWISQCYSLANDWSLPVDKLRIEQILQLYNNNLDQYALEIIGAVNDKEILGIQLLPIVGRRLKSLLVNSPTTEIKEKVANLSPSITHWIQEQDDMYAECDIKDTAQLANVIVTLLPEVEVEHRFAVRLVEAICSLCAL